jgi:hypothetical protein
LDSITWHFGNFGEPHLVDQTEASLREFGLNELADCFRDAKELMLPLLAQASEADDYNSLVERAGVEQAADKLERRGWDLRDSPSGNSAIYDAWVRYARKHPERVFGG